MNARDTFLRLAPRWLASLLLAQESVMPEWASYGGPEKVVPFDLAPAGSSKRRSYDHTPMFDIDVPAALVPSSTPGHHHLYIDVSLDQERYAKLVNVLEECGIIQPGIKLGFEKRGGTTLRYPWIRKGHETEDVQSDGHMSDRLYQWLLSQPVETPAELPF